MSLREHAERELSLNMAGEANFQSGIPQKVLELINVFRSAGHSGGSAHATIAILRSVGFEEALTTKEQHDKPVQDVIDAFSRQRHERRKNAEAVFEIFLHLALFQPLGPGGSTDLASYKPSMDYVRDVGEYEGKPPGVSLQCMRKSSVFSKDGGKTWYDIDRKEWHYP